MEKLILRIEIAKKYIARVAGLLLGFVTFTMISFMLNQMYVEAEEITWYRILWHCFYEDKGKIDDLYLGSSHVYRDIDPSLLEELSGRCHFNLASPSLPLNGSYYLLREADRMNELQHVYLEMFYLVNNDDTEMLEYWRNWNNTDYMKTSLNKLEYMAAIGETDQYVSILFPFSRYRVNLGEWEYVKTQLEERGQENYRAFRREIDYEDGNGTEIVERRGYLRSTRIYQNDKKCYPQNVTLSGYSMSEKNKDYLERIIEYCKKRDIPITLFVSPMNDLQLLSTLQYDDYITEIRRLAAEYGISFYDFNLAKEEYLPLHSGEYFRDAGHLNADGAEVFTPFLYQVLEEGDCGDCFYESYEEKLRNLPPAVYGIYYSNQTEEEGRRTMWIASNRDSEMEYRVILNPEAGTAHMVQDFDENKEFSVSSEEHGVCRITVRMKGETNEVQTMEIDY